LSFYLFSTHAEELKPETPEEDKKVERLPGEIKLEDEREVREKQNESKEHDEHPEVKDNKDSSATSSITFGKPTSSSKRRVGKEIIGVDEKVIFFFYYIKIILYYNTIILTIVY